MNISECTDLALLCKMKEAVEAHINREDDSEKKKQLEKELTKVLARIDLLAKDHKPAQ